MKLLVIGAVALASLTATAAAAQTQGPANVGPAIPGVCVYFNQRLLAQSTAGQAVQARMEQLATETQGELAPYASTIQTEIQALQQGGQNELRYTLGEQRRLISAAVEPLLVAVYQERGCGILIDRESVFIMNPAMDVTDVVIERLNTSLPTLNFNRLPVPAQQLQGQ